MIWRKNGFEGVPEMPTALNRFIKHVGIQVSCLPDYLGVEVGQGRWVGGRGVAGMRKSAWVLELLRIATPWIILTK